MQERTLQSAVEHQPAGMRAWKSADQAAGRTNRRGVPLPHSNAGLRRPRWRSTAHSETKTTGTADIELLPLISQTPSAESGSDSLARNPQTASAKSAIVGRTAAFAPGFSLRNHDRAAPASPATDA